LDDGTCVELANIAPVAAAECREGYVAAMQTEAISALVLEHDLQRVIHRELAGDAEPTQ
jgi:hypothetical protein